MQRSKVEDILMPGYVDRWTNGYFNLWNTAVYLAAQEGMLRIASADDRGQVQLSLAGSLSAEEDQLRGFLDGDAGEIFAAASLESQFLADGRDSNTCTRIRYVLGPRSCPDEAILECVEFTFDESCCFFVTPEWDGLVTGSHGSYEHWVDYLRSDTMDQRQEKVWRP
ncbi:hypothetical protein F4561_000258 [Lipingzhangella halophila]|uniref:Uncharacterized protein n=1 Tax=Lipingzhangella halophila TaxID=1783352 RepID=A0A7W7RD55_9ACTN|nr:hypothetical protein [Lipingzhangella halophila]MBB4929438.1 hypothetical protein [Lipingzhangella halophila]